MNDDETTVDEMKDPGPSGTAAEPRAPSEAVPEAAPARGELRYEGKAKKVFASDDPELLIVEAD